MDFEDGGEEKAGGFSGHRCNCHRLLPKSQLGGRWAIFVGNLPHGEIQFLVHGLHPLTHCYIYMALLRTGGGAVSHFLTIGQTK